MRVDDYDCPENRGVTDSGRSTFANWLTAAAIAAAGYNSARAVSIATDEWNLAKRYWQISNNWLDHYKNNYAPVEDQEINEALNLEEPVPAYDLARARTRASAWQEFRGVLEKNIRCTSEYCTGLREDMLTELASAQALALSMADGLGYRNERAYLEARDDVRFDKMMNTAKRGRDMVADNVSLARATAGIYGDAFNQAWEGLRGSAYYLGYRNSRNMVHYPTTYLGRSDRSGFSGEGYQLYSPAETAIQQLRGELPPVANSAVTITPLES